MKAVTQTLSVRPPYLRALEVTSGIVDAVARRSVHVLLGRITRGGITLVEEGEHFQFGRPTESPSVVVEILDTAAYRAILFGGSVGAGEAYMEGTWTCGDLVGLARLLTLNLDALDAMDSGSARLWRRTSEVVSSALRRNTRAGSRRNISRHYDLSNDLFRLFLDESMMYSSAIFEHDAMSLGEAQQAKLERICRRLDLQPTDHLLEIGTGWGALAIYAADRYGCRVTTTTISREQHQLATERVRAAGLEGRVEVLLRDYRDLDGQYDKLVSVEMVEAVGHEYLDSFFRVCSERLVPDGMMLLQAITIVDQRYERHRASVDFIKEHIFPGSCIPSVTSMVGAATRVTDLRLVQLEDLTLHYARTLHLWRERFLENVGAVRRLGFDAAFIRMWEFYLAYCEGAFTERYNGCVHMLFTKPEARCASGAIGA